MLSFTFFLILLAALGWGVWFAVDSETAPEIPAMRRRVRTQ